MKKLIYLSLLIFIFGCEFQSKKTVDDDSSPKIAWFNGSMEQALEKAKANDKALFVYWGATWCPPCNLLKSTVFKDQTFVDSTKKFIAVYLDGDQESSQKWGEKLHATGYPTIMVLNSKGEEVVRLTTTLPAKSLAATLDAAYERLDPIDEIVERILAKSIGEISSDDWKYLVHYSWTQDESFAGKKKSLAEVLEKLEAKVPTTMPEERSRLFLNFIVAKSNESPKHQNLTKAQRTQANKRLNEILDNPALVKYNLEFLAYYSTNLIKLIYPEGNALRDAVIAKYKSAFESLRGELSVGEYNRMVTYYPLVELNQFLVRSKGVTDEEKAKIKEEMLKANLEVKDEQKRIYTTNTSTDILHKAGMADVARQILNDELKRGVNDFYTMYSLAYLEKENGNKDKAIEWSGKAYKAAKGTATKIQWGAKYLTNMLEMSPRDKQKILDELNSFVMSDLSVSDAFMGRNRRSLTKLFETIGNWKKTEKADSELTVLKKKYIDECRQKAEKKSKYYIADCESFFKKLL